MREKIKQTQKAAQDMRNAAARMRSIAADLGGAIDRLGQVRSKLREQLG